MFDKRTDLTRLLAVAEAGRISWAADRLAMTQPALTRVIARLERQFGGRLFERLPDGLRLMSLGATVARRARRILYEFNAADAEIDAARSGRSGAFRVTAGPMWSATMLAQAVGTFQEEFPTIEVRAGTTTRVEGLRLLAAGESDMHAGGIDCGEDLPPFLRRELFLDMTSGIVASRGHPLLAGTVSAYDLVHWPWVDFDEPVTASPVEDRSPSLASVLELLFETTRTRVRAILRAEAAGLLPMAGGRYLAWLSLDFLERLPGGLLRAVPVALGRHSYRSGFVARRSAEDLPPFRRLEAILRETALGTLG